MTKTKTYTPQATYISKLKAHYKPPCECENYFACPWCDTIHDMAHELEKESRAHIDAGIGWKDQKGALPEVLPIDLEFYADYFAGRCCVQLREDCDHA